MCDIATIFPRASVNMHRPDKIYSMRKRQTYILAGILVLVSIGYGVFYRVNHPDSQVVFWDMMSNNLSTPGVTRVVAQSGNGLSVSQYTQLSFGATPTVQSLTVFKQRGGSIVTQQISNRGNDFVRYKKIVTNQKTAAGKPVDVSSVVGKWARLTKDDALSSAVTSGLFDQSLLGIVPVANLQPEKRNELLTYMRQNDVFTFDAAKVKVTTVDGRRTYEYPVRIQPATYIALMQQFGKLVGATQYAGMDPAAYAGATAQTAVFSVDVASHQLSQINQSSSGHSEQYKGFGIISDVTLPKAELTTVELQKRITQLR